VFQIERFTPEQESMLSEYRQQWIAHGLSCEPTDYERAKKAVCLVYQAAGLDPPKLFLLMDSPIGAALAASILKSQVGDQVGDQVEDQVWAQVRDQVRTQVRDQVWDQVGDQVWDQVRDQVWDQVWAQVRDQVGDQVWAQVWDQVRAQVGDQVRAMIYGSHDSDWLSFYAYMYDVFHLECVKPLVSLIELAQCCGWLALYKNVAILQQRHNILHRDTQGRLHSENSLAVGYPDGWGVFAWHGVRVPEYVILSPDKITVKDIQTETNAEIRRVKLERYGWERYLLDSHSNVIHQDEYGVLYRQGIGGDEPLVMVKVINATPELGSDSRREYFLRVPPTMQTAHQAVAWTFDQAPHEYQLTQET